MTRMRVVAGAFRLMGVVGICLLSLGVLSDTTWLSIVGGALLLVAVIAGLLDGWRKLRKHESDPPN